MILIHHQKNTAAFAGAQKFYWAGQQFLSRRTTSALVPPDRGRATHIFHQNHIAQFNGAHVFYWNLQPLIRQRFAAGAAVVVGQTHQMML